MIHTFQKQVAITPADTDFGIVHALFVGGGGTVILTDQVGTVATWTVGAGAYIFCPTVRVANASTATGIIGLVE
jgi:hypothetical protein|tara:strand:+ start:1192 stop:1413 length:222 start_codon:yes stop_codon:yes gene_type:complete